MNFEKLKEDIESIIKSSNIDLIQENANTDGKSPMGMMGLFASTISKEYSKSFLDEEILAKFEDGFIHIHDFDYYATGTTTCCQIPLSELLERGFKVGECYMRPPKSIGSAMALASIIFQSNQNQQHGGQSYPNWDFDLALYAEKTYNKQLIKLTELFSNKELSELEELAYEETKKETMQAAEAFVHNANSMLSRNGMQVPFVSINFGLDTSKFGRLVTECTLQAQMNGLGDYSTPLFPILVFKLRTGINFEPTDPNYDLYRKSLECLSKRLFPNFQFLNPKFNSDGFIATDPSTHVATMGCRTRVFGDVDGKSNAVGRGNLSFTTLNLPMIAQESIENNQDFIEALDYYADLSIKQLLERLDYQKNMKRSSFKFLYQEGVWKGSNGCEMNEVVGDLLNTGTLSLGFIGLAESLVLLLGKHHGESEEAQKRGLEIIKFLRTKMDIASNDYQLNFSLLSTPAESYSGKSVDKFTKKYGVIEKVSDREFFTNSSHVPVYYDTTIKNKVEIESPYHELTNAGHILYVEVDGEVAKNLEALDDIVRIMDKNNAGYGSINHPVDFCSNCNYTSIIPDNCPKCNSDKIDRIRRITGYLVGDMEKWNNAKKSEETKRVKHGKN